MSWFDNIREGASSVASWMGGGKGGGAAAKQAAPAAAAKTDTAGGGKEAAGGWGDSGWAKATGLSPWAKALGVGQGGGGAGAPAAAPSVGGNSAKDIATGKGDFKSNKVEGGLKKEGFGRDEKGGFKTPEYNNWSTKGTSYGNRKGDLDDTEEGKKDRKASGAPTVWQPSLDKIGTQGDGYNKQTGVLSKSSAEEQVDKTGASYSDAGSFRSSKYGSYSGGTGLAAEKGADNKFSMNHNGKGSMGIAGWEGQWGAEEKGGVRATAMSANKQHSASAEAGWVASGGASGSYGLDTAKGAYAQGGVGGKIGGYASADADTKTSAVKIGGVDYDMGAGVHGEAFVGAKAGASGEIGLGPDFIGAKGNIGAFAGAEAAGDVHANLGPLGAKAGGSVMAGAGIGAEGDLSYKDGKFHVGGKMFAALGYGGSLSADLTIDVGAMGRSAYALGESAVEGISDAGTAIYNGGAAAVEGIGDAASATWNAGASAVSSVLSW
jgi:hypothetical protein